jgi:hypothetical protein
MNGSKRNSLRGASVAEVYASATTTTILQVVDTREYEEQGDRWVPVPGSGNARDCDRCGRRHEVHAHVRYPDGSEAIVGTGCMGLGADVGRRAASHAGTIARLGAQLRRAEAGLLEATELAAWGDAQVPPPIVAGDWNGHAALYCGAEWTLTQHARTPTDMAERRETVVRHWRSARMQEHAGGRLTRAPYLWSQEIAELQRRLARQMAHNAND